MANIGSTLYRANIIGSSYSKRPRSHTLRYDLMTFFREVSGEPQFLAQGYLDDELLLRYDGDKRTAEPWGPGFEGHGGAETWARETETLREKEEHLREMLADVISQQSQNKGLSTLQATMGCELQRNGSTRSFWNLGYAGQNFLTFDPKTLTWAMAVPHTQQIKTFWETRAPRADLVKMFLDDTCPTQLQRHLASLRNVLQDTGPPMVTVTLRNYPVGRITLTCWAFKLYPRVATLVWLRDGKPAQQHTFGPGTILPSGDGTYQTRVSIWVLPGQEAQFTCNLKHHSYNIEIPAVSGHPTAHIGDAASSATASAVSILPVVLVLTGAN
ncbi:MHC class I-like protein MILL2 [Acomys russatus]|uniref:MHC class I-like protein MILL2 n=1 Tax=Acomys russatus TaxID=60746 RepID=UPI0021E3236D|nr:MHC class I-like protein MILL2 [Acomys russatus]